MKMKKLVQRRLKRDKELLDPETGEVLPGFVAYVAPRRTNGFGERWLALSQHAGKVLAENRETLGQEGLAVMFLLLSKLDFENGLLINQAELGRELGMHRQHVQRAIKRLIELGALLPGPKVGQNRSYRFNPEFGWKGSGTNHKKALEVHRDSGERGKKEGTLYTILPGGKPENSLKDG